jgi:peptide-methionine (S)-S-oxide reductase
MGEVATATFAAGCFWGVEDAFLSRSGVIATRVGYCGGRIDSPTYHDVCGGDTGHAEAVEVTFDPLLISYNELLKVFWECHDPTQLNRQGPDFGEQYRSAIFFHSEEQRIAATASRDELENRQVYRRSIVTQIVPAAQFWEAEAYHQKYHQKNGGGCGF